MLVRFWGVRGSIPVPGPDTVEFGGNTSCIEVRTGKGLFVLDAGTGIRGLGMSLLSQPGPLKLHLFITHTHWDHINGFPFFVPIYAPGNSIDVYGPRNLHSETGIKDVLTLQMDYSYFPVRTSELSATIEYHDLDEGTFEAEDARVTTKFLNHPVYMLGYRIESGGKTVVYTGDFEPYHNVFTKEEESRIFEVVEHANRRAVELARDADVLIADAQYTLEEYEKKRGWGHSAVEHSVDLAVRARAKNLVLFHHEPTRKDADLRALEERVKRDVAERNLPITVCAAREGMTIEV